MLTPRLLAICSLLAPYKSIADIGADHAYLSIALASDDRCKKVIVSDIAQGPVMRAKKNIERLAKPEVAAKLEVRMGDGLSSIAENEIRAIAICGMGGNMISDILKKGEQIAKSAEIMALQPMTNSDVLRRFLYENRYVIDREILIKEDWRIYSIFVVKIGETGTFTEAECYFSKALQIENPLLFKDYFLKRKREFENILKGVSDGGNPEKEKYVRALLIEFNEIENNIRKNENFLRRD